MMRSVLLLLGLCGVVAGCSVGGGSRVMSDPHGAAGSLGAAHGTTSARTAQDGSVVGIAWMIGGSAPGHHRLANQPVSLITRAGVPVAATATDSKGRFRFTVPAGTYELVLGEDTSSLSRTHLKVVAGRATRVQETIDAGK